jgi:hypothetical protein
LPLSPTAAIEREKWPRSFATTWRPSPDAVVAKGCGDVVEVEGAVPGVGEGGGVV